MICKTKNIFIVLLIIACMGAAFGVHADMNSSNYLISADAISIGGGRQISNEYVEQNMLGEVGTGALRSSSYIMDAGFLAMIGNESVLTFEITKDSADLGTLVNNLVKADTATFRAATTAKSGYAISVYGNSLSSTSHTITPLSSPTGPSTGNEQFGFNLRQNNNPTIGNDPSGGNGQAATGYGTTDAYKFVSGDTIAESANQSTYTNYTASFIGNISGISDAGDYSANLTVVMTGKF